MMERDFADVKVAAPASVESKGECRERWGATMEILKIMATGRLTLLEIAGELNLSREALKDVLRVMERRGDIKTWYLDGYGSEGFCEFCSCARTCSGSCPQVLKIIAYRLTEKGRMVVENHS